MNFSERDPSSEWTTLSHTGEEPAEAWFKPEGEPRSLLFRVPRSRFDLDDLSRLLTLEDLLRAAAVPNEQVESWQVLDESHAGLDGTNPELKRLLPPPPPDEPYLGVYVRLKPPAPTPAAAEDMPPEAWQVLEAKWKAILVIEAGIESTRQSLESLRGEMESAFRASLGVEDKVHALQSDVAEWNRAKNRIHYALPKAREFIHRATWALGVPERKRLEELFHTHIEPRIPFPHVDQEREKLEHLQKDRQVMAANGAAVSQECRGVFAEVQRALSTLKRNATENANRKRSARKEKGKHF